MLNYQRVLPGNSCGLWMLMVDMRWYHSSEWALKKVTLWYTLFEKKLCKDPPVWVGTSTILTGPWLQSLCYKLPEGSSCSSSKSFFSGTIRWKQQAKTLGINSSILVWTNHPCLVVWSYGWAIARGIWVGHDPRSLLFCPGHRSPWLCDYQSYGGWLLSLSG